MRRRNCFRTVLTINAVTCGLLAVMLLADRGLPASTALAGQPQTGIPDAGSQRMEMIRELRRLNASVEALRRSIEKSEFSVKVTSMPPVRVEEK